MGDYLRSALSSWVGGGGGGADGHDDGDNEFVGQQIELKGRRLKVDKVIAEGGFGFVFRVRDMQTHDVFALKRLIAADKEAKKEINNEIETLTKLQPHPHIMKFISWGQINSNIYLLLSEYCGCGSVKDLSIPIKCSQQLNRILYQTCLAIKKIHQLNIIHRDLKIENILFDNQGFVKLCDFGSATNKSYEPDHNWTPIQRSLVEDEMSRHTTPMYRPPEILDTYLHYPINIAMDIWAFGCMMYLLKFGRHPFEDSAKLRIINCNYSIPSNAEQGVHTEIIRSCLKVDPMERIKIEEIIALFEANFDDLVSPCVKPRQITPTTSHPTSPQHQIPTHPPGSSQPSMSFSGFTRYLKETSTKVMKSVQQSMSAQEAASQNQSAKATINHGPFPVPNTRATFSQEKSGNVTPMVQKPARPPQPEGSPVAPRRPPSPSNNEAPRRPPPPSEKCNAPRRPPPPCDVSSGGVVVGDVEEKRDFPKIGENNVGTSEEIFFSASTIENEVFVEDLLNLDTEAVNASSSSNNNVNGFGSASADSGPDVTQANAAGIDLLVDTGHEAKSQNSNFDLLNDIFSSPINGTTANGIPPAFQPTVGKPDLLFSASNVPATPLSQQNLHRNTSTPNLTKLDPLTELGSFMSTASCMSPTHQQKTLQPSGIPRVASYSTFQASSIQSKPDYSRIHFTEANTTNATSSAHKVSGNEFEDLLQGFPRRPANESTNKTMGALKKQELIKDGLTREQLMVMEWKENKTRNIRALLSSLHTIVWEECNWQKIGMHQLINTCDVKKMYRKACIAVHPDKVVGTAHEELAKLIFVELNDAWSEFEKQQGQA